MNSPSQSPVLPRKRAAAPQPPAHDNPPVGHNRLGRYQVTGRLGKGGMGVVYEAEDTLLKRTVAIKLLPREVSANPDALKRFLREAQAAARLNHPNVVAVYDIGGADGAHFIVMELMKGGSAQDVLQTRGRFPWLEATSVMIDVCRGVAAAHKEGMIHRDIKPANILRSTEGIVKLGDFGLVKPAARTGTVVTKLGNVVGTPHYMSPEQSQSDAVDARTDIYALGATYFALVTGRPPYPGTDSLQVLFAHCAEPIPDPRELVSDIPAACGAIIRKAMAKKRADRYANAEALLADLEQLSRSATGLPAAAPANIPFVWNQADRAQSARPLSLADAYPAERTEVAQSVQPRRWHRHRKVLAALLVLLVFALLIKGLFSGRGGQPDADKAPAADKQSAPAQRPSPDNPPVADKDDWPTLVAATGKASRKRNAPEMRKVLERIRILDKRLGPAIEPAQREAMDHASARLEKTIAFRESIREQGLSLGMNGRVASLAFSPDDRWLAAGHTSGDGGAVVWDSHTGEKRWTLGMRQGKTVVKVHALSFSHDNKTLAAGCNELGIRLWHLADGRENSLILDKGATRVLAVAFSPAARHLVVGLDPGGEGPGRPYLKIWDVDTQLEPFVFKAEHAAKVGCLAYSPLGQQVASGSQDKRVVMWNADTGRIWRELRTGLTIHAIDCASDGNALAVAGADKDAPVLQIWDYAATRLLHTKASPHGACRCVAYAAGGALLASGSGSNILLWHPKTYALVGTLTGHSQEIISLAFAAEGGILVSGSADQTMRLWDVTRFLPAP